MALISIFKKKKAITAPDIKKIPKIQTNTCFIFFSSNSKVGETQTNFLGVSHSINIYENFPQFTLKVTSQLYS